MFSLAKGCVRAQYQSKVEKHIGEGSFRPGARYRNALLGSSALLPAAAASVLFAPEAEGVSLDRSNIRELLDLNRLLYHAVDAVSWTIDSDTQAAIAVFDDGWRGIFEVGEYLIEDDKLYLWPENVYVQAYPMHALWNLLWGHPAAGIAGGGLLWLLGYNSAPLAVDDRLAFVEGDELEANAASVGFNVLDDDSDPNGDAVSLVPFEDVQGDYGRFTMNGAGTDIIYHFLDDLAAANLGAGETDTDTARYTIQDEHGKTATATLTVTVTGINKDVTDGNEPGKGAPNGDLTEDDGSLTLTNLLDNAEDIDGGDPFISAVNGEVFTSPDDPIEVDGSNGGGFVIYADGRAEFRTRGGYENLDKGDTVTSSVTYTVSDGRGSTTQSTATVTITGENDGFDLEQPAVIAVSEDDSETSLSGGLLIFDTEDPDSSDSHTVTNVTGATKDDGTFTLFPPEGGTVTITAGGAAKFDPGSDFNKLSAGEAETISVEYTVSDSSGNGADRESDTETLTIKVTGANDAVSDGNESVGTGENTKYSSTSDTNALKNVSDPDESDTYAVSKVAGQTSNVGSNVTGTGGKGTFNLTANGAWTFDPGTDFDHLAKGVTAETTLVYTVTDDTVEDTSTITVTITGENDAISDGDESYTGDNAISTLAITENGSVASGASVNVLANVVDPDAGDTKHVSEGGTKITAAKSYPGSSGGTFTLTDDGALTFATGTDFDDLTGGETETTSFSYEVTDGYSTDTSTATVQITGVNDAPRVTKPANDIAMQEGKKVSDGDITFLVPKEGGGHASEPASGIGLEFDDVDHEPTLVITGIPDHIPAFGFTSNGGLSGTAELENAFKAETHTITVKATDGGNSDGSTPLSVSETLTLYIGLNVESSDVSTPQSTFSLTGSDVAKDEVLVTDTNNFAAGPGNTVTIDLGDGTNVFKAKYYAGAKSGKLTYIGGNGDDTLHLPQHAGRYSGEVVLDAGDGNNSLSLGNFAGANNGRLTYTGGTGTDTLTLKQHVGSKGFVGLDLGEDAVSDSIEFQAQVGTSDGDVRIYNFDPEYDTIAFNTKDLNNQGFEPHEVEDFNPLVLVDGDSDGNTDDIRVSTIDPDLDANEPPINLVIIGDYDSVDLGDFAFSMKTGGHVGDYVELG